MKMDFDPDSLQVFPEGNLSIRGCLRVSSGRLNTSNMQCSQPGSLKVIPYDGL